MESSERVKQHLEMLLEQEREERERKARNPEPVMKPSEYQDNLALLLDSGFAVLDEQTTRAWKERAWYDGLPSYRQCYTWTPEGKIACFRNRYTTPMAWAANIAEGARHCIVCGRDCYRLKVWAQVKGKPGVVCMSCGAKGHGLQDLEGSR